MVRRAECYRGIGNNERKARDEVDYVRQIITQLGQTDIKYIKAMVETCQGMSLEVIESVQDMLSTLYLNVPVENEGDLAYKEWILKTKNQLDKSSF